MNFLKKRKSLHEKHPSGQYGAYKKDPSETKPAKSPLFTVQRTHSLTTKVLPSRNHIQVPSGQSSSPGKPSPKKAPKKLDLSQKFFNQSQGKLPVQSPKHAFGDGAQSFFTRKTSKNNRVVKSRTSLVTNKSFTPVLKQPSKQLQKQPSMQNLVHELQKTILDLKTENDDLSQTLVLNKQSV